jgi:hypothetical protein
VSLFSRGWAFIQVESLSAGTCSLPRRAAGVRGDRGRMANMAHLASVQLDYFRLEEHVHHWLLDETAYDRILVYGAYQDALLPPLMELLRMHQLPARLPVWDRTLMRAHTHSTWGPGRKYHAAFEELYSRTDALLDDTPLLSVRYGTASTPDHDSTWHLKEFLGVRKRRKLKASETRREGERAKEGERERGG